MNIASSNITARMSKRNSVVQSVAEDMNEVLETLPESTSELKTRINSLKREIEIARYKPETEKDCLMDRVFNELILTESKLTRMIRKYK